MAEAPPPSAAGSTSSFGAYKRFWESGRASASSSVHDSPSCSQSTSTLQTPKRLGSAVKWSPSVRSATPTGAKLHGPAVNTPRISKLKAFLKDLKLDGYLPAMQTQLGVALFSDLLLLTPEDIRALDMKALEERRLLHELDRLQRTAGEAGDEGSSREEGGEWEVRRVGMGTPGGSGISPVRRLRSPDGGGGHARLLGEDAELSRLTEMNQRRAAEARVQQEEEKADKERARQRLADAILQAQQHALTSAAEEHRGAPQRGHAAQAQVQQDAAAVRQQHLAHHAAVSQHLRAAAAAAAGDGAQIETEIER